MSIAHASASRAAADRIPWSIANRVGLAIGMLYQAAGIVSAFVPLGEPGKPGPPAEILIADAVLSSITALLLLAAWFTRRRLLARLAVAIAVIEALTAFPAFFVPGVPAVLKVLAAISTLVVLVSSILILLPTRGVTPSR